MQNRETSGTGGKGAAGTEPEKANPKIDTAAEQSGAPTTLDQSIEEERQQRQENWSPAAQTGFDNADVDRQDEIYTQQPPSETKSKDR